jgi:hypothetical protein
VQKIFPSFWRALRELSLQGREFSVVLRTFGTDVEDVRAAINDFAAGQHPLSYAGADELQLPASRVWRGRYRPGGTYAIERSRETLELGRAAASTSAPATRSRKVVLVDEQAVVDQLELRSVPRGVAAVTDDYAWWRDHGYHPSAGKPLWLERSAARPEGVSPCHHIFFDDNIHCSAVDSIVAVRMRSERGGQFQPLGGAETLAHVGTHLVRVQTADAILDDEYFLKRIAECEAAWRGGCG